MKNLRDLFPQNTPAISSQLSEVSLNGQPRLLTFAAISGLPSVQWHIGLSIDKNKAYASPANSAPPHWSLRWSPWC